MKFSHRTLIFFSGFIWLGVGILLLSKGLRLIVTAAYEIGGGSSLFHRLSSFLGNVQQAALFVISLALLMGFIKGRFILSKTVARVVARIFTLPSPVEMKKIYTKNYYILLGAMVCLGMVMRGLSLSSDIRGFIDVTIGSALVNGAILYFRSAFIQREKRL